MGRLRSRKFLIIPTRQYFYKDKTLYRLNCYMTHFVTDSEVV